MTGPRPFVYPIDGRDRQPDPGRPSLALEVGERTGSERIVAGMASGIWHGNRKCPVNGAKLPKANRVSGQRCPFCDNVIGAYMGEPDPPTAVATASVQHGEALYDDGSKADKDESRRNQAWGAIAGGALMFVGSFLPWVSVTTIFGTLSRSGVDGNGDGIISAGLGIAAAAIGVALFKRVSRPLSLALISVAILGAGLVYLDVTNIQRSLGDLGTDAALASVGIGLWVVGAGAALSLVMGLEGLRGGKNPFRPAPGGSR